MNFKAPRDPNTESPFEKLRDAKPGEICSVGSGECTEQAVEVQDDTEGGEFFLCAIHVKEFHALGKLIAEMPPSQISKFENAVKDAEQ